MPGRVASPVFVGRRQELATLLEAVTAAADGRPSFILVDGEAGIGKSRLIRELVDRVGPDTGTGERAVLVLEGSCVALGEGGLPFAPIVEVLRSLLAQVPRGELSEASGRLPRGWLGWCRSCPMSPSWTRLRSSKDSGFRPGSSKGSLACSDD